MPPPSELRIVRRRSGRKRDGFHVSSMFMENAPRLSSGNACTLLLLALWARSAGPVSRLDAGAWRARPGADLPVSRPHDRALDCGAGSARTAGNPVPWPRENRSAAEVRGLGYAPGLQVQARGEKKRARAQDTARRKE